MITVTLPDGSIKKFNGITNGIEIAKDISNSLAKKAIAIVINDHLSDLSEEIDKDSDVRIITKADPEALDILRHDTAHIMAQAVQELFENVQVTIGPNVKDGFYYDFAINKPFHLDDLEKIEKKMKEIVDRNLEFKREVWDRNEAIDYFKNIDEHYKAEIISDLPANEPVSIYRQGENWLDLCRGPHMPSTAKVGKAFKLLKLAGAYWRGDSNNQMLQRIYGTAWTNETDLKKHLYNLEEAEKRDHRKLGREMDLYHFQEEAQGSVFWHPKGWRLFQTLISYMRRRQLREGFMEINSPDMMDKSLWERSGHMEKFAENMYMADAPDGKTLALKPMNCPGHVQIYKNGLKSYRDLPFKLAEFGKVHRFEPSGALHGLLRVRSFTQDDSHIFCTEEQITEQCIKVNKFILSIYADMGFKEVRIKFSDRPDKRVGSDEIWDKAETALKNAIENTKLKLDYNQGEGAFYGPKLEYVLTDAIGRDWQCGTLQVDLNMPGRLGAFYIDSDGEKKTPVMLHQAFFGSLERFTGILIEHHAGRLPIWLAPVQIVVASITEKASAYSSEIYNRLLIAGFRAEIDIRSEKINYKVREHSNAKIPLIFVCGMKEAENSLVSVRRLGSNRNEIISFDDAIKMLKEEASPPDAM